MRRNAVVVMGALGLALLPGGTAFAAPTPAATPGKSMCQTTDPLLSNVTGLVATATGYAVVRSDSQMIYLLDSRCKRKGSLRYSGQANSPQDVSVGADGTMWVADTGEADANPRPRIALWKVPANGGRATIYRFTYPNGAHYDARAMVMSGNGTPIFITKIANGPAVLYEPSAALNPTGAAVPLKKVGEFSPQHTGTSNPLGTLGNLIVTGGATSPDGTKVVLRTYSDAYQWTVTGGDVAAAITGGTKPIVTPLPDETSGEAIAYSRDGQYLLTASSTTVDTAHPLSFLRYTPTAATGTTAQAGATGEPMNVAKGDTRNWWDKLTLEQISYLVGAVGVIGLLMVVGGVLGIRRARRRPRPTPLDGAGARGTGSASVPVADPHEQGYDPYGPEQYGPEQQYGQSSYDPYGNQYGGQYGGGYPPQDYRSSGYGADYDQPGPGDRYPQGGGTYQSGGGYQGGYDDPPDDGYRRVGEGQGVGRVTAPRPPGYGYPEGPSVYGGQGR